MYSKIKLHGYCDVNYIWSKIGELSSSDIDVLKENGIHSPIWDSNTVTLSTFQDSINGNTNIQHESIVGYIVQRKRVDEDKLYTVTEVPKNEVVVYDFNVQNKNEYIYYITPVLEENGVRTYSNHIETSMLGIDWNSFTIADIVPTNVDNEYMVDKNNIWNFGLNIKSNPITPTFNKRYITGFGQFPKAVHNELNYLKLGFECLLGSVKCNGCYADDSIDKMEKWHRFCNNGNMKILKDIRGNVIICDIEDTSMQNSDETIQPFTTLSFNVVQLADRKDVSAYSFEV